MAELLKEYGAKDDVLLEPQSSVTSSLLASVKGDEPRLNSEAFSEVYRRIFPLAERWKTIGVLLGILYSTLDTIGYHNRGCEECLVGMLRAWLKCADPPPTWKLLADVLELVEPYYAEEIRSELLQK